MPPFMPRRSRAGAGTHFREIASRLRPSWCDTRDTPLSVFRSPEITGSPERETECTWTYGTEASRCFGRGESFRSAKIFESRLMRRSFDSLRSLRMTNWNQVGQAAALQTLGGLFPLFQRNADRFWIRLLNELSRRLTALGIPRMPNSNAYWAV